MLFLYFVRKPRQFARKLPLCNITMVSHLPNGVDLMNTNLCRCCLKSGCYKDISAEYYQCGEKEVYEDMLKYTFDVQISHNSPNNVTLKRLICEDCIVRLREAYVFKKMVLSSESSFQLFSDGLNFDENMKSTRSDINISCVKVESVTETDFEPCQPDDSFVEDNEMLANVKHEPPRLTLGNVKKTSRKRKKPRDKTRKCKMNNIVEDKHKLTKTWTETSDRRGKPPILRENSLKLLANSNICVFQWNKSRYRCFCCTEPFNDMNSLKEHTNAKHTLITIEKKIIRQQNRLVKVDISLIYCKICNEKLSNLDNLQNHLYDAHNIDFASPEHLLVPFKIKDGGLTCQICFENFNLFRVLNIHMNKHYQKHICDKCGAGFSNLVFLNLHKTRIHRPLKCVSCNVVFKNKIDRKNHEVKVHNIERERRKRFPCPYCDERFLQEYLKVEHLIKKHNFKKPEHKCSYCSKLFITKSLANNHVKYVHLKEKIHECDVCHTYFYTRSDLNRHKSTHSGEKKFSCTTCNNLFATKDSLRRHSKRSHSE